MQFMDEKLIRTILHWDELIPAMERALALFSRGQVIQPVRNMITLEEGQRYFGIMPAASNEVLGLKAVSFYPANAGSAVPTHSAMIMLFRPDTGEPLAVMDGRLITEMRTAAVSAAVTRYLAPADTRVLGLLGSGVQAKAHLEALSSLYAFDDVRVWSRTPEHARRFAEAHGARAVDTETAVRGADIVVSATNALEPVLRGAWLKQGCHVNSVGSPRPSWRELDDEAMENILVVDSREAAQKEAGDVILSKADIFAEAGELFAGTKTCERTRTTIFKSVGLAVEDVTAAKLVWDKLKSMA